jgi:CheY-like chemotaxis protein
MQLQQSQKMEAIGTLAAGIAHDFNNILTAICGYVELALMDIGTERLRGHLAQVNLAANRAKELVSRILSFGRKSSTGKSSLVMGAVIEEGVRFLRAMIPSTVEIRVSINDRASCVSANPIDMQQVLINLASNAAQAIGAKPGVIEILVDRVMDGELPTELRRLDKGKGLIRLTVKDNGRGIPHETLCRIFEPYFTTKPKGMGSGLGLSVVHTIVKSCGGAIQVSSALGQGATFDVYLPRIQSAVSRIPEPETIAGGSGSILLVDDEPEVRTVGKELLSRMGYNVFTNSDPIEALKEFGEDPDRFDLALIDQTMPGMTGNELARRIKEVRPGFPVILCSGYTSLFSGSSAPLLCADLLIKKPFVVTELDKTVRTLIAARRSGKPKSTNRS